MALHRDGTTKKTSQIISEKRHWSFDWLMKVHSADMCLIRLLRPKCNALQCTFCIQNIKNMKLHSASSSLEAVQRSTACPASLLDPFCTVRTFRRATAWQLRLRFVPHKFSFKIFFVAHHIESLTRETFIRRNLEP